MKGARRDAAGSSVDAAGSSVDAAELETSPPSGCGLSRRPFMNFTIGSQSAPRW
jgi:hypothetical protein